MSDPRKLVRGETKISQGFLISKEERIANASAKRTIEGLTQNDQIIALLTEQNDLLRYMADRLYALETKQ